MLLYLSHRRLPSSVEFPADQAVLRAFASLNKTASISAPHCSPNPESNCGTQPGHPRDVVDPSPTHHSPISIHPLVLIQFP